MTYHSKKTIEKFFGLCDWLMQTYEFRKRLFDENPDEGELRNPRHEHFFYRIQVVFQESWMHQLARLHDPAVQGGNINLTFEYIIEYGGWEQDFKDELLALKRGLDVLYPSIKIARNKLLAHNDYKTMIGQEEVFGSFKEGEDEKYFTVLREFCERISQQVFGEPFVYDDLVKNDVAAFMTQFMRGKIKDLPAKQSVNPAHPTPPAPHKTQTD